MQASTVLVFPVLQMLLVAFDCRDLKGVENALVLHNNPSITCYEGSHYMYIAAACIGMLCYYPLASFLFPLMQFADRR